MVLRGRGNLPGVSQPFSPSCQRRPPHKLFLRMNAQFRRDVESILDVISWQPDGTATIKCPGEHLHHSAGGVPLFYPSPPHIHCFHQSCRAAVQSANYELALLVDDANEAYDRTPTPEEITQRKLQKRLRKLRRLAETRLLPTLQPVS